MCEVIGSPKTMMRNWSERGRGERSSRKTMDHEKTDPKDLETTKVHIHDGRILHPDKRVEKVDHNWFFFIISDQVRTRRIYKKGGWV